MGLGKVHFLNSNITIVAPSLSSEFLLAHNHFGIIYAPYCMYICDLRSKLCSSGIGHVQTGWSPIGCEGFEFLEFSLSEINIIYVYGHGHCMSVKKKSSQIIF